MLRHYVNNNHIVCFLKLSYNQNLRVFFLIYLIAFVFSTVSFTMSYQMGWQRIVGDRAMISLCACCRFLLGYLHRHCCLVLYCDEVAREGVLLVLCASDGGISFFVSFLFSAVQSYSTLLRDSPNTFEFALSSAKPSSKYEMDRVYA